MTFSTIPEHRISRAIATAEVPGGALRCVLVPKMNPRGGDFAVAFHADGAAVNAIEWKETEREAFAAFRAKLMELRPELKPEEEKKS